MTSGENSINVKAALENNPPQSDFIWPGFLKGTVGALIAPGGMGKSFWALQAAMSTACSVDGGDVLNLNPVQAGRVAYYAAEDPESALICRVHAIGKHLAEQARKSIADNLIIEPIMGKNWKLMDGHDVSRVIKDCQGFRLIVLDTLTKFHLLDENSKQAMAEVIWKLEHIASQTGASVLFLHRISKVNNQPVSGSSTLINNVGWCGFLETISEVEMKTFGIPKSFERSYVKLEVNRQCYPGFLPDVLLKRAEGGVLVPINQNE